MMRITQHLVWGEPELETLVLIQNPHSASLTHVPSVSEEIHWKTYPIPQVQKILTVPQIVVIQVLHLWSQSHTLSPQSWIMRPQIWPQTLIKSCFVFC